MSKKLVGKALQRKRKKKRQSKRTQESYSWKNERDVYNAYSQLADTTMIHELMYEPMNCVLCNKMMMSIHDTHNPSPIAEHCYAKVALENGNKGRCCGECNQTKVFPARLRSVGVDPDNFSLDDCVIKKVPIEELDKMVSWSRGNL